MFTDLKFSNQKMFFLKRSLTSVNKVSSLMMVNKGSWLTVDNEGIVYKK